MNRSKLIFRNCLKQLDRTEIATLLMSLREELFIPDRYAADRMVDLVFEQGGFIGGFDESNRLQAAFGFFFGDPSENYLNKDTLFIYVAAISRSYRHSRAFLRGLGTTLQEGHRLRIDQFRIYADMNDPYINRLYSKFSTIRGIGKNVRGYPVNVYGGTIDDFLDKIDPSLRRDGST